MGMTTDILNITTVETPEETDEDPLALSVRLFAVVFLIAVIFAFTCSWKRVHFRDHVRNISCCNGISCNLGHCASAVRRCCSNLSCDCTVCKSRVRRCWNSLSCDCCVCKSGVRRCWGAITNALSRRTQSNCNTSTTEHAEGNCNTGSTNTDAPPTGTVLRLSSVIVEQSPDPPPSMTLPPSYDSIVTNPSEPPPSYEEAVR